VTVRKKDFAAKEVNVCFKTASGEVIEQGKAVMASNGGWVYRNLVSVIDSRFQISDSRFNIQDSRLERTVIVEVEAVNWDGGCQRETSTVALD
jgi:hypothetical protein